MKKLIIVFAACTAISATAAYAQNTIYFDQTDATGGNTVGMRLLTINQTGEYNVIGKYDDRSVVKGALDELTIDQIGDANTIDFAIYGTNNSTSGKLDLYFSGDTNSYDLTVGSSERSQFNPRINAFVVGSSNAIVDSISGGTSTSDLNLYGVIYGDGNSVTRNSSGVFDTLNVNSTFHGDNNGLIMELTNIKNGDISAYVSGDNNNWTLTSSTADYRIDVSHYGSNVTGNILQTAEMRSDVSVSLDKIGTDAFTFNASSSANYSRAEINLVALGGGNFTLNQTSYGSEYNARHVIAAGGTATINQ
jgi:hypothetical protein